MCIYICGVYIYIYYCIWYMEHPLISLVIHSWSFPSGRGFLDYQRWPEIQVAGIRPMISSRRSRPFLDSMTLTCGHGPWRPWSPGNAALLFVVPAITITIAIYYYCYYYYSYIYIIYIINIIYIYNIYVHWMSQAEDMGFNAVEFKYIHTVGVLASNRFQ